MSAALLLPVRPVTDLQSALVNLSQMAANLRLLIQAGHKREATLLSAQLSDWLVELADQG